MKDHPSSKTTICVNNRVISEELTTVYGIWNSHSTPKVLEPSGYNTPIFDSSITIIIKPIACSYDTKSDILLQ